MYYTRHYTWNQERTVPRKLQDSRLDSRTARLKLAAQDAPYFRSILEGWAIGYRSLAGKSGTWLARLYVGHGRYLRQDLGVADDLRAGGPALAELTVTAVVEAYLAVHERRSKTRGQDARWRLTKHVLTDKKLAVVPLPA